MKTYLINLLSKLLGVGKEVISVLLPVLQSNVGNFLGVAVPLAEQFVLDAIAKNGHIDNATRDTLVDQLKTQLVSTGKVAAAEATTSLLRYAVDTAYHNAVVGGLVPATTTTTATSAVSSK